MYLSRPIFTWPINWKTSPAFEFEYELNEILLGFASPRFERAQAHTVHGFEFEIMLEGEQAGLDFAAFLDQVSGRLNGFWIASPFQEFGIVAGVSTTEFIIRDQRLRDTLADHPGNAHAVFTKPGQAPQYTQILSVEGDGDGRELVTTEELETPVDATWTGRKLLYVRFTNDEQAVEWLTNTLQRRKLRVIELPNEYAEAETGRQPVYLYSLFMHTSGEPVHWRFTGLNRNIVSNGTVFQSFPIEHGSHTVSCGDQADRLQIQTIYDPAMPLTRFFPFRQPKPIWVTVEEVTFAEPNTRFMVFEGVISDLKLSGQRISANCTAFGDVIGRRFPRFLIQPRCNYFLYSLPCKVNRANFDATVKIIEIDGRTLKVERVGSSPDVFTDAPYNYFALGYLETGTGANYEVRTIESNLLNEGENYLFLYLNAPLSFAVLNQTATIFAGCDGTIETCHDKFDNKVNWGGHVIVPNNLSVRALTAQADTGAKK